MGECEEKEKGAFLDGEVDKERESHQVDGTLTGKTEMREAQCRRLGNPRTQFYDTVGS
jgi:hypothetical protein